MDGNETMGGDGDNSVAVYSLVVVGFVIVIITIVVAIFFVVCDTAGDEDSNNNVSSDQSTTLDTWNPPMPNGNAMNVQTNPLYILNGPAKDAGTKSAPKDDDISWSDEESEYTDAMLPQFATSTPIKASLEYNTLETPGARVSENPSNSSVASFQYFSAVPSTLLTDTLDVPGARGSDQPSVASEQYDNAVPNPQLKNSLEVPGVRDSDHPSVASSQYDNAVPIASSSQSNSDQSQPNGNGNQKSTKRVRWTESVLLRSQWDDTL